MPFAYRFAGYGTHEWVMYYDLVRFLIWEAVDLKIDLQSHANHLLLGAQVLGARASSPAHLSVNGPPSGEAISQLPVRSARLKRESAAQLDRRTAMLHKDSDPTNADLIAYLGNQQAEWLSTPNQELDGSIPAEVIDNERRRWPEAMTGRSMVVDDDCYCCKLIGDNQKQGWRFTSVTSTAATWKMNSPFPHV